MWYRWEKESQFGSLFSNLQSTKFNSLPNFSGYMVWTVGLLKCWRRVYWCVTGCHIHYCFLCFGEGFRLGWISPPTLKEYSYGRSVYYLNTRFNSKIKLCDPLAIAWGNLLKKRGWNKNQSTCCEAARPFNILLQRQPPISLFYKVCSLVHV